MGRRLVAVFLNDHELDNIAGTVIINMLMRFGLIDNAEHVFRSIKVKDSAYLQRYDER